MFKSKNIDDDKRQVELSLCFSLSSTICNDKLGHHSPLKSIINYEGSMRIKLLLLRNRRSQNNLTTKDKNSNLTVCERKRD